VASRTNGFDLRLKASPIRITCMLEADFEQ